MILMYIDPATGGMLFSVVIGILGTVIYAIRALAVKLKFSFAGGHRGEKEKDVLPFVFFSDNRRYWNVFEPICDEFERRGQKAVFMTASADDPALEKPYEHIKTMFIGEGNRAYAKLNFLKADILVATTPGLDVYQWKRSRDVKCYIHIPHACTGNMLYRMFGQDYYDVVLGSGTYQIDQIRELEERRGLPKKEIPILGIPYMDMMRERLTKAGTVPEHPVTVLLAPTWGASGIFSRYGGEIIDALLSTGYHIIVRPHPQSFITETEMIEGIMQQYPECDQLEWNRDNDNFEVLRRSDILISDFSGVIYDYVLVFDKPIIYTDVQLDKSPYDAWWLKEDPWNLRVIPKLGLQLTPETFSELKKMIDTCLNSQEFKRERDKAREETWQCMGEGTALTVDYLLNKQIVLHERRSTETQEVRKENGKDVPISA